MPDVLHFTGRLDDIDFDHIYGPDRDRRYLIVKSVAYDAHTNITELRLRALLGEEFRKRVTPLIAGQAERQRIRELLNDQ